MIQSGITTVRKYKKQLVKVSDNWEGNVRTFLINVNNIDNLEVILANVSINGATLIRYLEVIGINDNGEEYIEGVMEYGSIFEAKKSYITRQDTSIFFNVSKYSKVKVTVQLNSGQSLNLFVKEGKLSDRKTFRFFKKEWGADTRTAFFDVGEIIRCKISLKNVAYKGNTLVRYLNIKGHTTLADEGVHIEGRKSDGTIFEPAQYSIVGELDAFFDLSNYHYISVKIQLNPDQSLDARVNFDDEQFIEKDRYYNVFGRFPTNGKKYFRFCSKLINNPNTTRYAVKGYDYNGNEVVKTLAGLGYYAEYFSEPFLPMNLSGVDSFVDISDCKYIELTSTQASRFDGFVSFFDNIEEEYKDVSLPVFAVRGFRYIIMEVTTDFKNVEFCDESDKTLLAYNLQGEFVGAYKLNFKKGYRFILDTYNAESVKRYGVGNYRNVGIAFDFNPPKEIDYINAEKVRIVKRNTIAPLAELGRYVAYTCARNGRIYLTDSGKDYNECEYSALISDFPNIGSQKILTAAFIPYTRNLLYNHHGLDRRLCIQFDDSKIYHNFPNRAANADGNSLDGDIALFDESVVWDAPKTVNLKKFPSKEVPTDTANYYYDPSLEDENYELFPALNQDNGYGNTGFGINAGNRVRLRKAGYLDLLRGLNNIEIDKMYSANDSYRSTTKNCMFETSDGGRQWFVQADLGAASKTYGKINTANLGAFVGNVKVQKIELIYPSDENKDPIDLFTLGAEISVLNIENALNPAITANAHGLKVGDRVVFTGDSSSFDWMLNNTHDTKSAGNGQVYRVSEVPNLNTIKVEPLAANVNTNIVCAHIHSVNRIKEGWIMSTGEEYPNGWLIYIPQKPRDFYSIATSATWRGWVRLTSSKDAIQRCVGALVLDDDNLNPTVIVSIDTFNFTMPTMKVGDREVYSKSSGGIRIGKLTDLDDFSKFNVVAEMDDSGIGMKRYNDVIYCYGGGSGRFAVSGDNGKTWNLLHWMDSSYRRVVGITSAGEFVVRGNYVIGRK